MPVPGRTSRTVGQTSVCSGLEPGDARADYVDFAFLIAASNFVVSALLSLV